MTNVFLLDNPREDQEANLNMLQFTANNLLNLINVVLDINEFESGKITIEKIPLKICSIIKNISIGLRHQANEKKINTH